MACVYVCKHSNCHRRETKIVRGYFTHPGHCNPECPWTNGGIMRFVNRIFETKAFRPFGYDKTVLSECKPSMGDDYPAVLRQVKGYGYKVGDKRCVVVRRFLTESVSWEQVVKIFAASDIALVREPEVQPTIERNARS
jgi:hypothetical protein